MPTLGVALITLNEESNIAECLASIPTGSQIVVVDSHSTDRTVEIAQAFGARTIVRDFQGYSIEKQFAVDQLNTDWVLALDADEFLTEDLQDEVANTLTQRDALDAYEIPRVQIFMSRHLKRGRGVDYPLRLFKKNKGRYDGEVLHESVVSSGEIGRLGASLMHRSSPTISDRIRKIRTEIALELKLRPRTTPVSKKEMVCHPVSYFLSYLLKKGVWRDGMPGVIFHFLFAWQIFLQNAMDYEQEINKRESGG